MEFQNKRSLQLLIYQPKISVQNNINLRLAIQIFHIRDKNFQIKVIALSIWIITSLVIAQ